MAEIESGRCNNPVGQKVCLAFCPLLCFLMVAAPSPTSASVTAHQGGITVMDGDYTLERIAQEVDNPSLFRCTDGQAVCSVPFTLKGRLTMRPGESLTMANPQGEFGRRFVYLMGEMDWQDCTLAGAFWVDVTSEARGRWRNVRILAGDNQRQSYPLLYWRSSALDWQGGLLDADCGPDRCSAVALSARGGYYPHDVTSTIREVTIRSREYAVLDSGQDDDVELTFERCTFETRAPEAQAKIVASVNVTDLGRTRLRLINCRRVHLGQEQPFDEIEVTGSASEVVVAASGEPERRHLVAELHAASETGSGNLLAELVGGLASARRRWQQLVQDRRLQGSLFYAGSRLDFLEQVRETLRTVGCYSDDDERIVARTLGEVRDTLNKAPLTLVPGSPYRPRPVPLPPPPASGKARVETLPDGRVRVSTFESVLFYHDNADGEGMAAFTSDSRIRGRPLFDAFPPWGGPSLRHLAPTDSSVMLWEKPWMTRLIQPEGRIVGFSAQQQGPLYGVRVTFVFFYDLPDVILYEVESLQPEGTQVAPHVRMAAYATVDHRRYNGMRFWNDDPQGLKVNHRERPTPDRLPLSDPVNGCFITGRGNWWFYPTLVRGALVAQHNGYNHWRLNPPSGYIIKRSECEAVYTNLTGPGGYYAHVVQLSNPDRVRTGNLKHHLLWFEGAGLGCWENLLNLDDAFNHPCELAPLVLRTDAPLEVAVRESSGLARHLEIVILPPAFSRLQTDRPVFRGPSTILLLRSVAPHSLTPLGKLPISLRPEGADGFVVQSELEAPLAAVEIHLPLDGKRPYAIQHGETVVSQFQIQERELVYTATVAPGKTPVQLVLGE